MKNTIILEINVYSLELGNLGNGTLKCDIRDLMIRKINIFKEF